MRHVVCVLKFALEKMANLNSNLKANAVPHLKPPQGISP